MRKSAEGETRLVVEVLRVPNAVIGASYPAMPYERRPAELSAKLDAESVCNERGIPLKLPSTTALSSVSTPSHLIDVVRLHLDSRFCPPKRAVL
jgi:hypothetical protein